MITLVPAYGRDYKSRKEVETDFNNNKDFTIMDMFSGYDGKQANKRDLEKQYSSVKIRYNKNTKVTVIKL